LLKYSQNTTGVYFFLPHPVHRHALHWEVPRFKRGPGRPRTNRRSTINKDLLRMGITWEEAAVVTV